MIRLRSVISEQPSIRWEVTGVAAWLVFFALTCSHFAWTTSPAFDEPGLIQAGYANLTADAAKSSTGNVVLSQMWTALPLLTHRPVLPTKAEVDASDPETRDVGRLFLFHAANDWKAILRPARAMIILLGVVLGFLVF